MQRKDYYGILGVSREADEAEIKIAYRKRALQNHPDTNSEDPEAEERFKEINEAYEVLSHTDKRRQYDAGYDPLSRGFPFRPPPFDPWSDPFEEIFFTGFRCRGGGMGRGLRRNRRVFQGSGGRPAAFVSDRSTPHIHDLPLTADEALKGTERDIRLHTGRETKIFTVSIPAGIQNGTILSFKHPIEHVQEMELLFRVRIAE